MSTLCQRTKRLKDSHFYAAKKCVGIKKKVEARREESQNGERRTKGR